VAKKVKMIKYYPVYTLFLMFVFHSSCGGQNQTNPPQDNTSIGYTESQLKEAVTTKVPMGMVRHVRQARNGEILIASYLGIFRYDGTSFTNLTGKIISPRFSSFWDVLEDRKGNLWFASMGSGVYYYNGKSFQHFTTEEGLASNSVGSIYEDKAGNIWFGASRYDGKSFRNFTTKDGFPSNSIRLLLEDKTGKLWFGAQGENMFVYDGKTFTVLKNKDGKAFNNVWSVIEDKKGNYWFGDSDGFWRYDGSTFTKVSQKGAYAIVEDKKGNIWTTGSNGSAGQYFNDGSGRAVWALSRYDAKSLYNKNPSVTEIMTGQPGLLGLLEANDGTIWFGSYRGVYRYDGKTITDFKSKAAQQ
jgi:ligand-binding sensor domain-containing protein